MNRPGCRPPLTNIYLQTRVLPAVPGNCALRKTQPIPPPYINNVAVPGALVVDPLDNSGNPTALTTFFLGGQTQIQAMRRAKPTFVSVERSEEHTSELQSPCNLLCRLLLEKKKKKDSEAPTGRE